MEIVQQGMMAVGLAACAGLRAWLPLFGAGLFARMGYIPLDASLEFLKSDPALVTMGIATVLEFAGDKIIALDNLLDSIGTVIRPAAGAVVAAGMLTSPDPTVQTIMAIILGGGTALTVHAGKAALRGGATLAAPAHGGAGNTGISFLEDIVAAGGIWLVVVAPIVAFLLGILLIYAAVLIARRLGRASRGLFSRFKRA